MCTAVQVGRAVCAGKRLEFPVFSCIVQVVFFVFLTLLSSLILWSWTYHVLRQSTTHDDCIQSSRQLAGASCSKRMTVLFISHPVRCYLGSTPANLLSATETLLAQNEIQRKHNLSSLFRLRRDKAAELLPLPPPLRTVFPRKKNHNHFRYVRGQTVHTESSPALSTPPKRPRISSLSHAR